VESESTSTKYVSIQHLVEISYLRPLFLLALLREYSRDAFSQFADMVTNSTTDGFEPGTGTFATHWQGAGSTVFGCPETNTFPNFRAGCLGNWNVDSAGVINMTKYFPASQISNGFYTDTSVNPEVAYPQASPIGLGMIIHANTDPCNGNSTLYGARLAGGVIGVFNRAGAAAAGVAKGYATPGKTIFTATCRLVGASNNDIGGSAIRGAVWFRQSGMTTSVRARISGIVGGLGAANARSMHVHDFGSLLDLVDGLSTGGHWNPNSAPHALPPQEPRHQGDLGRITVINNSTSELFYNYQLTSVLDPTNYLYHPQLDGVYSILGRGLILHSGEDIGCKAASSNGAAGARAAACVIGLAPDSAWDNLNWNSIAPTAAQSIIPQPGDICTAPSVAATPKASSAAGVAASFVVVALAALFALAF
jgi:superoxide dismutase, Cu-Zn family